ncbi:MAG: hypothetical protein AAFZ87_15510 [Planctomycetota bacterium]
MEFVFVLPRFALFPECAPHGLSLFGDGSSAAPNDGATVDGRRFGELVRQEGFFVERDHAERTPTLKQIIPYTLVRRGGEILCLERTKAGGEARLHGKLSIGVGGHVNPVDAQGADAIDREGADASSGRALDPLPAATRREVMEEELFVTGATRLTQIGLINDDTNAVGAVHVGLVQVLDLIEGDARVREVDQLRGAFASVSELRARLENGANFETWSALLVPELERILEIADRSARSASDRSAVPSTHEKNSTHGGNPTHDGSTLSSAR